MSQAGTGSSLTKRSGGAGSTTYEDLASPGMFRFAVGDGAPTAAIVLRAGRAPYGDAGGIADNVRAIERTRRARFADPLRRAADAYLVRRGGGQTIDRRLSVVHRLGPRHVHRAARAVPGDAAGSTMRGDILLAVGGRRLGGHAAEPLPRRAARRPSTTRSMRRSGTWSPSTSCSRRRHAAAAPSERRLLDAVDAIVDGYARGTRFGIRADDDGLLAAGEPGVQLTWMDAKVGDWVVTPRIGKPVEIQALWINALAVGRARRPGAGAALRERATASFATRFWDARARLPLRRRRRRSRAAARTTRRSARTRSSPSAACRSPLLDGAAARARRRRGRSASCGRRSGCARSRPTIRATSRRYDGGVARARRRLPPGHGVAVAAGAVRRGLGARARRHAPRPGRGAPPLRRAALARISTPPASATVARLPTAMRRTPRAAPVPGLVAGRAAAHAPPRRRVPHETRSDSIRNASARPKACEWQVWGPYLSERQWGTVREDYSAHGTAWEYFPHDHARSRAYRWGEDGIGGFI